MLDAHHTAEPASATATAIDSPKPRAPQPLPGQLKFASDDNFLPRLRERVEEYFARTGLRERDCPRMYAKTAVILAWLTASYAGLLVFMETWWLALPLALSLGLAMAAVGFNIQHDGGHHSYSSRGWVNRLMAFSLDLLGGSSYIWDRKHNRIHHSYTNVTGHDEDISLGVLGRLSPHQKRLSIHRFQHFYLWFLYGFLPPKWQFFDDFRAIAQGRIEEHKLVRPKGLDLATLVFGKILFFSLAFVVPLIWYPLWMVLLWYFVASLVQGVVLSVVFQLAHCVEEAEFPMPDPATGRIETAWADHQIETTVNFARNNRFLCWFVGGLNFQIEHHLFPRICHIHYPAISQIVEESCRERGLAYRTHRSFRSGIASHYRWLRRMGQPSPTEATV